ncbi:MAG: hypothetical protein IJ746_05935 [Ruminococcus sp.]|nr:hypothetical protein [Ruminococcus sp.]
MRSLRLAACAAAAIIMSGCTSMNLSVDNLLAAPKLTNEQSEIHEALINAVGSNITLKYPRNGDNRSAYVVADIDNEETDEAMVFYEYSGADGNEDGLRVNLLDRNEDGEWYSVKEIAGAGTEIDKVILTKVSGVSGTCVLVGYQTMTGEEKTLEIYSYRDGELSRIGTDTYSVLEAIDLNSDGTNELVTIRRSTNAETGQVTAKASLLEMKDGEITAVQSIDMCDNVTSYVRARAARVKDGRTALYVDSLNAEGSLQTEIIYYRYSALQNPMSLRSEKLLPLCTRPTGYYSVDIDEDGVIEIPATRVMLGYESALPEDQVLMTSWTVYQDFYELEPKYSGYYSVPDGFTMIFPSRWTDKVTVKKDSATEETVFYKYEGDINAEMTELMRIAVKAKPLSQDYIYDGYQVVRTVGQLDYLVKLPTDRREQLILTIDEVSNNFYVVPT